MRRWLLGSKDSGSLCPVPSKDSRSLSLIVLLLTLTTAVVARQGASPGQAAPPATGTGVIYGRVVDAGDGSAIGEATVEVAVTSVVARVFTDGQGRFVFRDLPKASYALSGFANGFLNGSIARPAGPLQVMLGDGERKEVVIKLMKCAVISGTMTDEVGDPVGGARISVFPMRIVGGRRKLSTSINRVVTDDRGIFRLAGLAPGDYVVAHVASPITMPASALIEQEQASAAGPAANQAFSDDLVSSGANLLTGPGNIVGDLRLMYGTNARPPAPTEDGQVFVYPTTFYPGATSVTGATTITLTSGQERGGVDFELRPVRAVKVSGTVVGPNGSGARLGLRLVSSDAEQFASDVTIDSPVTMTNVAGAFTFLGIVPGSFTLRAAKVPRAQFVLARVTDANGNQFTTQRQQPDDPAAQSFWATMPVQVGDADVTGLTVTLKTGTRVSGRVEFTGAAPPPASDRTPAPATIEIVMAPGLGDTGSALSGFQTWRGAVAPNLTFVSPQLPPGHYFIRATSPGGKLSLDAVIVAGRDMIDLPIEVGAGDINDVIVKFTDHPATLTGVARDFSGPNDPPTSVVIFPVDPKLWTDYSSSPRRVRLVVPRIGTGYSISPLSPGDYFVAAVRDGDSVDWPDPKFLDRLSRAASRVTIAAGEAKTMDLATLTIR